MVSQEYFNFKPSIDHPDAVFTPPSICNTAPISDMGNDIPVSSVCLVFTSFVTPCNFINFYFSYFTLTDHGNLHPRLPKAGGYHPLEDFFFQAA